MRFSILLMSVLVLLSVAHASGESETQLTFFVSGDPQYLAEKTENPTKLDSLSEQANSRFIRIINQLPQQVIPKQFGGGKVAKKIRGMIVTGDLIDSLDKNGRIYTNMQKFEWERFLKDYGQNGTGGKFPYPIYELHGNHDGPQGNTFLTEDIIKRNKTRFDVVNTSANGLHYSWNWGKVHLINVGMFVGGGDDRREGHHYAARNSLKFLKSDLAQHVGRSGRPVIISHHLHLNAPEYDWPREDLKAYYETIKQYNVIAIFNGHTHGSPPRHAYWNGFKLNSKPTGEKNFNSFDPDDSGAAKIHNGKPVGLRHGFLYVEIIDHRGEQNDMLKVRSYMTKDNWETHGWDKIWEFKISIPDN